MTGSKGYRICNRCIMDTSDPEIRFDDKGYCNHCSSAIESAPQMWFPDEKGEAFLNDLTRHIRETQKHSQYDCIIGLSGGIDSSYLAWFARVRLGLRPLVVHVDCGWNSELAVKNIENITRKLDIELHTFVVNWEEMKDLHRAFFEASLMDQDIPQDHAIFAALYKFAAENHIRFAFNGVNYATEIILPSSWGFQAMDLRHLKAVHCKYGTYRLKDYPTISFFKRYIYFNLIHPLKIISPLNYIDYQKDKAVELLENELDWKYYGGKHHESRFTKFYQNYYLPEKFGISKKRAHLSSMIISGQINREAAVNLMNENDYTVQEAHDDLDYVAKKLGWTTEEFKDIIARPPMNHRDFPNNEKLFSLGLSLKNSFKRISSKF